jgi:alpha-tubulin suppressor-like RCC1 family protein
MGESGTGTPAFTSGNQNLTTPTQINFTTAGMPSGVTIKFITCSYYMSAVLDSNNNVWGFGNNAYGSFNQPADSQYYLTPTQLTLPKSMKSVATGYYHTLGLATDGTLYSWGWNRKY